MQTTTHTRVPALRFPEFEGDWEVKRFGGIYTFYPTNSYSRSKLNYESGLVENIHYGDIHKKLRDLLDINKETLPFINEDVDLSRIKEESYCQEKDLVIADASEDYADIGKCTEIANLNGERVLAGLHTFLARPNKHPIALGFTSFLVHSWFVRKQVLTIAQGSKVISLSTKRLANVRLPIPSLPEQQKIANFLAGIDQKISLLEEKKQQLQTFKKGMMQQLFSQQLRFKDENGEDFPAWEDTTLGEIAQLKKGKGIAKKDIVDGGKYPCIRYGELYTHYGEVITVIKSFTNADKTKLIVSVANDIIIPASGESALDIATAACVQMNDVILGSDLNIIRTTSSGVFLAYYLNSYSKKFIIKAAQGVQVVHLYRRQLEKIKINLPSLPEQQKIANYLNNLDQQIQNIQDQLTQTQAYKKGLLQQLLV